MKVGVAAKTLSNRVASSILSCCSSSILIPADTFHTAEFIGEIDQV